MTWKGVLVVGMVGWMKFEVLYHFILKRIKLVFLGIYVLVMGSIRPFPAS